MVSVFPTPYFYVYGVEFSCVIAFLNKYRVCNLLKKLNLHENENFCEVFVENRHLYIEANFYI